MATPAIAKLARLRRILACTAPLILTQDYRTRLERVSIRTQPARSGRCTLTDRRDSHLEAPLLLVLVDGAPAKPPVYCSAEPAWQPGDVIPCAGDRLVRVIERGESASDDYTAILTVQPV